MLQGLTSRTVVGICESAAEMTRSDKRCSLGFSILWTITDAIKGTCRARESADQVSRSGGVGV